MYGLVNRAVEDFVSQRLGAPGWNEVKRRAGCSVDVFLSMETYPDEATVALVVAGAAELGVTPAAFLEELGEHWIGYASRYGYDDLMRVRGASLFEFISRLDDLHTRLSLTFPKLRPPSFVVRDLAPRSMRLIYISERAGLAPFVIGLIRGLGKLFDTPVSVVLDKPRGNGAEHDEFIVTYL